MQSRRLALLVVGVILLLMGIVFALQGANVITGSSVMSGNSTYIYVGAVIAIIGLALLAWASMSRSKGSAMPAANPKPVAQ